MLGLSDTAAGEQAVANRNGAVTRTGDSDAGDGTGPPGESQFNPAAAQHMGLSDSNSVNILFRNIGFTNSWNGSVVEKLLTESLGYMPGISARGRAHKVTHVQDDRFSACNRHGPSGRSAT